MRQGTISKSSLNILREVYDNPGTTQTKVAEDLELSFTAVSRHFRDDHGFNFLNELVDKKDGDDGREKKLYINEERSEDAEVLIEALRIVENGE